MRQCLGGYPNIRGSFSPRKTAGFAEESIMNGAFKLGESFADAYLNYISGTGYFIDFDASQDDATYAYDRLQVASLQALACIKV